MQNRTHADKSWIKENNVFFKASCNKDIKHLVFLTLTIAEIVIASNCTFGYFNFKLLVTTQENHFFHLKM